MPSGLGRDGKAILLLGGRVNGHSLNGWAAAPSVGVAPIYTSVISFMQTIAAKRRAAIWRHATHESQGPSGVWQPCLFGFKGLGSFVQVVHSQQILGALLALLL